MGQRTYSEMLVFVASAYAFSAWTQLGQDIDGENVGDFSGESVAMSSDGTTVAISAMFNDGDDGTKSSSGHVRVYGYSGNNWTQIGQDIDGESAEDESGHSVAMSSDGTKVAIGAIWNDGDNGTKSSSGHVRVYGYDDVLGWTQVGDDIDGENAQDFSGYNVAMSSDGTTVAIGAKYNNGDNGTKSSSGHVRVYGYSGNTWSQIGQDIDGESAEDESGHSVAMSSDGTKVAISARRADGFDVNDGTIPRSGHVRVYSYDDVLGWTKLGDNIDGEGRWDFSGNSVTMSSDGTKVAISAVSNNGDDGNTIDVGHVRVFGYDDVTGWTQLGDDIDGENEEDESGYSVAMSSDGTKVAIGAIFNDGDNGTKSSSGHVRVYGYDDVLGWTQVGDDIDGENAYDYSGHSVAMSSDGTTVAIGAKYNDGDNGNRTLSGHVRVYEFKATKDDDEGLGTGAIVGIAVAATVGAAAIGTAVYYAVPFVSTGGEHRSVGQPFL